jgi:predicted sulfurtransferase
LCWFAGKFQGAVPLPVDVFRDAFPALDKLLEKTEKNAKVMIYCTGGIRWFARLSPLVFLLRPRLCPPL